MANAASQRPTAVEITGNYAVRIDYDASNNPIYVGKAQIGSATSSAVWQVMKLNYDASNNLTSVQWPGNEAFTYVWDNRASLSWA